jgi:hypothetical protein
MAGPFNEAPYPQLQVHDFGPGTPYRVIVENGGRTIVIGDHMDLGFQKTHTYVQPGPDAVDVVIHGLPGRFIEQLGGKWEIPVPLVAQLIETAGIRRGTALRLLTCHAAEAPLTGLTAAQQLATEWGGPVTGPNGLLRIGRGTLRIDLVDWDYDPVSGGTSPTIVSQGQGSWVCCTP